MDKRNAKDSRNYVLDESIFQVSKIMEVSTFPKFWGLKISHCDLLLWVIFFRPDLFRGWKFRFWEKSLGFISNSFSCWKILYLLTNLGCGIFWMWNCNLKASVLRKTCGWMILIPKSDSISNCPKDRSNSLVVAILTNRWQK